MNNMDYDFRRQQPDEFEHQPHIGNRESRVAVHVEREVKPTAIVVHAPPSRR